MYMTENNDQFDVAIVGAGLGGLIAGAKLAKEGKKVLIVEQHSKLGGCATHFKRNGISFEIGLHEMDGLNNPDDPKNLIFSDLNVFEHVEFLQVPEFYRITNGRFDVVVPHGVSEAINAITIAFPKEHQAINTFFRDIEKISRSLRTRNMVELSEYANMTVGEYLDQHTENEAAFATHGLSLISMNRHLSTGRLLNSLKRPDMVNMPVGQGNIFYVKSQSPHTLQDSFSLSPWVNYHPLFSRFGANNKTIRSKRTDYKIFQNHDIPPFYLR